MTLPNWASHADADHDYGDGVRARSPEATLRAVIELVPEAQARLRALNEPPAPTPAPEPPPRPIGRNKRPRMTGVQRLSREAKVVHARYLKQEATIRYLRPRNSDERRQQKRMQRKLRAEFEQAMGELGYRRSDLTGLGL